MSAPIDAVRLSECDSCGELILTTIAAGIRYRLSRWTVPTAHAEVLDKYGIAIFRLIRSGRFAYAADYSPSSASTYPLITTHICGIQPRRNES